MRSLFAVAVLASVTASAGPRAWENGIDGVGQITVFAGYKLTPNDYFFRAAETDGYQVEWRGVGGPQGALSFGYGATSFLEATIDVFVGNDRFKLKGSDNFTVMTYGALLGVTLKKMDLFMPGLWAQLTVQLGPTLGYVNWPGVESTEKLTTGYSFGGGVGYRITDTVGLQLHYRFLLARGGLDSIGRGVNVGGSFFSLGLVIFFPRDVSADLPAGT